MVFLVFGLISTAFAEVPAIISYQGILTDNNGAPLTGNYDLTVRIYEQQSDGTAIWNETHTGVSISGGVFNIKLGSVTPFDASVDFSTQYWLGVSIDGGAELVPRTQFTSVGTALMAKKVMDGGIPPGMIAAFAMPTAPAQWLACNGQAVSRTEYPNLFAAIGTMYGVGDGSTTFNLPDYRGYFLRGWDNGRGVDPDAANRTDRGDGTVGDNVGTQQSDAFKSHMHSSHRVLNGYPLNAYDQNYDLFSENGSGRAAAKTSYAGGSETRPQNISVLYCIKY
jgi:phage-related tail fiber protein